MGQRHVFQCDSSGEVHTAIEPPTTWQVLTVQWFDPVTNTTRTNQYMICPECWGTDQEAKLSVMLESDAGRQALMDDIFAAELLKLSRPKE